MADDTRDGKRSTFTPIVTQKATDLIADQIRKSIFSGEFQLGDLLPSEDQLVKQTESSRVSVRGALQILQTQGFIRMKPGRSGGAIVQTPGESELEETMSQLIRGHQISLPELFGMQEAIEPLCAQLAAANRTDEDIELLAAALAAITAHTGDIRSLLDAHSEWHVQVARASHNGLLSGLMVALVHWIHVATSEMNIIAEAPSTEAYEKITAAIVEADSEAAFDLMGRHVVTRAESMTRLLASQG